MNEKDVAEIASRIVCELIEAGPYNATEYPQILKIYEAVNNQVAKSAVEAAKKLNADVPEVK